LVGRGAGLTEIASTVLVVRPNLALTRAAGNVQAIVVQDEIESPFRLAEEAPIRLLAIELKLRQAPRDISIDVALNALPTPDNDRQVPFRQGPGFHHKIPAGGFPGLAVQCEHGALDARDGDMHRHLSPAPVCRQ